MPLAHRPQLGEREFSLRHIDPNDTGGLSRAEGEARTLVLLEELAALQELLYAACCGSVLIVLQGMDTSGKDGAIKKLTGHMSSQGCDVASFKAPTEQELAHDFLWRVHAHAPCSGHVKIFNRSHYEDVLVTRVHGWISEDECQRRYEHINNFERLLADAGTTVLKFYLHISSEEQEERLRKREQDRAKYWKLSVGDWKERSHWDEYGAAYDRALAACDTEHAPWFVVPANKKWFRDLCLAEAITDALRPHRKRWLTQLDEVGRREMQAIEEYRAAGDHKAEGQTA